MFYINFLLLFKIFFIGLYRKQKILNMNTSDQRLLKTISIFFKVVYIIMFVFLIILLLGQGLSFLNKDAMSIISTFHFIPQPDFPVTINGKEVQPDAIFGYGALMMHGLPAGIKILNNLLPVISLLIYMLIIRYVQVIIKSISAGEIFSIINAVRLKNIGLLLLADFIISYSFLLYNSFSFHNFEASSIGSAIGFVFAQATGYIVAIVFTFFMAAVFKIGVTLQEENQSFV